MLRKLFLFITLFIGCVIAFKTKAEPYLMLGLDNYPPYSYIRNNQIKGIDVDVAKEAFRRAGYKVSIDLLPWKRILASAKNGSADGTLGAFITEERRVYLDYIEEEPLCWVEMSLFTHTGSSLEDSTLASLKGYKIGINRGFTISPEFDAASQNGSIKKYSGNNIQQLLRMLTFRRLDGVVHTKGTTQYYINEMGLKSDIHMVKNSVTEKRGSYMSLSKTIDLTQRQKLKTALNSAMTSMREDGTLQRIRASYTSMSN